MKIVLSTPPWKTTELWPPLGLLYIASSLTAKRGDEVKIIDAFCENLTKEELVERIAREEPDVFGMNSSTHTFLSAISTLNDLSKALPDTKMVMGGFQATFAADRILRDYPFVDFIIKGEAESAFPQLLDCIEETRKPMDVEGISFIDGDSYYSNPLTMVQDLDSLPFPARHLAQAVDYAYFFDGIRLTFGKLTTFCSSRGCPYQCTYCSCAAFSNRKWRPRSAENVVKELETLYSDGYESCVMVDDNLTHNKKRMQHICDLIRSKRIKLQFYCEGRVDNASYSLFRTMKKAGFNIIYFGVESASQKVLDYYKKGITPEQSIRAIENAKKAGMIAIASFIIGAPGETEGEILKTIELISKARPHAVQMNILDCLIGTPIWDDMVEEGIVAPEDWKTNHRIFEYNKDGFSKEDLNGFADQGYAAYVKAWKSTGGIIEGITALLRNRTARVVASNTVFNPHVKEWLRSPKKRGGAG
ncbi:MAG: B12-binding domain-containing radical SAM protein [Methanomassiliicoccales archaeon]|nr:B12-binding domain-containing radical SAM protein [Methanomassiliicoccales archaeon]